MRTAAFYTCPNCQASVQAVSKHSQFVHCEQCDAFFETAEVKNQKALPFGKVLPGSHLRIQVGTSGVWKGENFDVTGRACCFMEDDVVNLWTLVLAGDKTMMLYEAEGALLLLQEHPDWEARGRDLITRTDFKDRSPVSTKEGKFRLQSKLENKRMLLEGEGLLPDRDGIFACFHLASMEGLSLVVIATGEANKLLVFEARAIDVQALNLTDNFIPVKEEVVHCLECSQPIPLKARQLSAACVCSHCGTRYLLKPEGLTAPDKGAIYNRAALALHSKGTIGGVDYTVCGMTEKGDPDGYKWREYTLFSPIAGYAWLSEYAGHWTFLQRQLIAPVIGPGDEGFYFEGQLFELFNAYYFIVEKATGEFAEAITQQKQCKVHEYICPPYIWVRETDTTGYTWFKGRHIGKRELKAAFEAINLPYRSGVGAVQPDILKGEGKWFYRIMGIAALLFLIVHFVTVSVNGEKVILDTTYPLPDSAINRLPVIIADNFELTKSSNLLIEISAPVSNDWFELGVELTNLSTGKEYGVEKGVEFYSGYEDGGTWTEGSQYDDAWISSLPKGRYAMQLQPVRGSTNIKEFRIKVTNDAPMTRNLVGMLLILAIVMVLYWLYSRSFENSRWANSPYSDIGLT